MTLRSACRLRSLAACLCADAAAVNGLYCLSLRHPHQLLIHSITVMLLLLMLLQLSSSVIIDVADNGLDGVRTSAYMRYRNKYSGETCISSIRNAWQSLAYSPLGAVVSPPSEY